MAGMAKGLQVERIYEEGPSATVWRDMINVGGSRPETFSSALSAERLTNELRRS